MSWAAAAGIKSPRVAQAQFGELRGAQALEDLPPNEPIITVPRSAALVVTPQQKRPYDFVDAAFWKGAPWYIKMSVLLLGERQRGEESRVWGYIQQLPDSIDTPVRWKEADLAQLQYRPAIEQIQRQQQRWERQFQELKAALTPGAPPVTWDDFLWAMENVRSRSFSGPYTGATFKEKLQSAGVVLVGGGAYVAWAHLPLQQALNGLLAAVMFNLIFDVLLSQKLKWHSLCPVVDSVNHSSLVESDVSYEYFQDSFALSTSCPWSKGQQVFISYGKQGNDSLLQYYGFVEPGNPNDTYAMDVQVMGSQTVKVVLNSKGGLDGEGLATLRAAVEEAGGPGGAEWKALAEACKQELGSMPSSVAHDERTLQTPHLLTPRLKLALEFRLEKKRLLQRCAAKAEKKARKKGAATAASK